MADVNSLDDDAVAPLDGWWRAANYLSVGQIYPMDNPLLRTPLDREDVKPRLLGHWGTTPGLNFLYANLNRAIRERQQSTVYVTRLDVQSGLQITQGHQRHCVASTDRQPELPSVQPSGPRLHRPRRDKKAEVVRVYLPPDANTLLSIYDHCLRSRQYVNVVVAGKQPSPNLLTMEQAVAHCTREHGDDIPEVKDWAWPSAHGSSFNPDVGGALSTGGDNE